MEIQAAIAKVDRYSSPEQGDKVEVIERPNGGISFVMAEGKISGQRSKAVTMKAVHRTMSLISEGIHDGASARAVLSGIKSEHQNHAEVNLSILSCDLESGTIVITKNHPIPIILIRDGLIDLLRLEPDSEDNLKGNPCVYQFAFEAESTFVLFSDGVYSAGQQTNQLIDLPMELESMLEDQEPSVEELADFILTRAINQDTGRPRDDMTVLVIKIATSKVKDIRKVSIHFPL